MAHLEAVVEAEAVVGSAPQRDLVLVLVSQSLSLLVLEVLVGVHGLLVAILLPVLVKTLFLVLLYPSVVVAAVVKTMSQQTAVQAVEAAVGPTDLLNKILVLEHLVKVTVVLQASKMTAEAVVVVQVLLVRYSMAATDLQVPLRECLLHTLVAVEQAAIQLLGTAVRVEAVTVLLTPMCLPAAGRTSAEAEAEAENQTHTQVFKLVVAVLVVQELLSLNTRAPSRT